MTNKIELTEEQKKVIDKINQMGYYEMSRLWRNAPIGHPYFDTTKPYANVFKERLFEHFGGLTPVISKLLGW